MVAFEAVLTGDRAEKLRMDGKADDGFVMVNRVWRPHSCSMKITEVVRKYAGAWGDAEEKALQHGMRAKPKDFMEKAHGELGEEVVTIHKQIWP